MNRTDLNLMQLFIISTNINVSAFQCSDTLDQTRMVPGSLVILFVMQTFNNKDDTQPWVVCKNTH